MVQAVVNQTSPASEPVFNQTWIKSLIDAEVFEGDPKNWKITENNCIEVLKTIQVNVAQFKQVLSRAIMNNNDQLAFEDFCQLFHKELVKAAAVEVRAMDDTDLLETPAQKIISLLREIQNKYVATN